MSSSRRHQPPRAGKALGAGLQFAKFHTPSIKKAQPIKFTDRGKSAVKVVVAAPRTRLEGREKWLLAAAIASGEEGCTIAELATRGYSVTNLYTLLKAYKTALAVGKTVQDAETVFRGIGKKHPKLDDHAVQEYRAKADRAARTVPEGKKHPEPLTKKQSKDLLREKIADTYERRTGLSGLKLRNQSEVSDYMHKKLLADVNGLVGGFVQTTTDARADNSADPRTAVSHIVVTTEALRHADPRLRATTNMDPAVVFSMDSSTTLVSTKSLNWRVVPEDLADDLRTKYQADMTFSVKSWWMTNMFGEIATYMSHLGDRTLPEDQILMLEVYEPSWCMTDNILDNMRIISVTRFLDGVLTQTFLGRFSSPSRRTQPWRSWSSSSKTSLSLQSRPPLHAYHNATTSKMSLSLPS